MTSQHIQHPGTQIPECDDFKVIRGIGPAVEGRLYAAGICTYAQLATQTPEELATLLTDLAGLSTERIAKQDWIGQAAMCVQAALVQPPRTLDPRQHYETFTVRLLLNEQNETRSTTVVHTHSSTEGKWPGWDAEKLNRFVVRLAKLAQYEALSEKPAASVQLPSVEPDIEREPVELAPSMPADQATDMPLEPVVASSEPEPSQAYMLLSMPVSEVHDTQLTIGNLLHPTRMLCQDQPFTIWLSFDFDPAPNQTYRYTANVYAKKLGGHRQTVGEQHGQLSNQERTALTFEGIALTAGRYRLEATMLIQPVSGPASQPGPVAMIESGLLLVC